MKKNIYIVFVLAAVSAVACTDIGLDDVGTGDVDVGIEDTVTVPKAIAFETMMSNHATKAPSMTLDYLKDPDVGFGVNAVFTDGDWGNAESVNPDFIYDRRIRWNGTQWDYDPVEYWPTKKNEKVSFFAWAPYGGAGITICDTTEADPDPSRLHFSMADSSNMTTDFVAASAIDNSESNPNSVVTFIFRHALTRLEMFAKVDEDLYREDDEANRTRVIVKSARLVGSAFYTEGTYLFNTAVEDRPGSWDFEGFEVATDYPVLMCGESVTIDTKEPYTAENAIVLTSRNIEYQLLLPSHEDPEERYILLIPPRGTEGAYTGDVAVEFRYDIVTEDPNLMKGYTCTSATKVVNFPMGTLKQGYTYKYTFTFCLNRVELDVLETGTGDEEDVETNI